MYARVVSVLSNSGTGTQNITFTGGTSFTPKVAIVQYSRVSTSADAFVEGTCRGYGFTNGTSQRCVCAVSEDAVTNSDTAGIISNNSIITTLNPTGTVTTTDSVATFTQWITDGMQITWSDAPASPFYIQVMFLGGSDLTDSAIGTFQSGTVTGNITVSSLSFQPDFLMCLASRTTENTAATNMHISIGAATSSSAQWSQNLYEITSGAASSAKTAFGHDRIQQQLVSTISGYIAFTSFASNGFTLNCADNYTADYSISYLALKGGDYSVGNSTEPGSTGNQTITVSKDVQGVLVFGLDAPTAATVASSGVFSTGMGTGSSEQGCEVSDNLNASDPMANASRHDTDQIYLNITANATATSSTLNDEATLSSVSSTGFVLNWTNIGNARPFRYITFGGAPSATLFTTSITESSITVSDSNARLLTAKRTQSESSIAVSDSNTRLLTAFRTISESSIAVSESLTRRLTAMRALSESSIAVSETLARVPIWVRSLADTAVTVSDSLARLLIAVRSLSESSIVVSDTVLAIKIGAVIVRSITEPSISVSETLARSLLSFRTLSEPSIAVSDSVSRVLTALRVLSESSIAISETLARTAIKLRSLSETVTVSDSLARILIATRSLAETAVVSDTLSRLLTAFRTLADTVVVSDSLARTPIRVRALSETVVVSETIARLLTASRTLSESSIVVSDSLARLLTANRTIVDTSIAVSETVARRLTAIRTLAESAITVSDSITRLLIATRALSGPVTVSDSLVRRLTATRLLSEPSIAVSDTVARQLVPIMTLLETVIVSDSISRLLIANRTLAESTITVSDILAAARLRVRLIAESAIAVSDSIVRRLSAFRVIGETVSVSEVLLIVGPDYEVALYISDRGYSNPLRTRIQFISRNEPYPVFYTYDSFNPDARPFNIINMSVRLAQGEIGTFSMTIEDSAGIVDKAKIGLGVKVVVEARKEFATPYFKLITGFVRRIRPLRPASGALLYQITGYGSQVVFNERIVNFKRAAKRTAVDSTIPLSTDSQMQAHRLFSDLITATDIIPLKNPTIQSTGKFELGAISPEVTDFIAQIAPGLTDAASVANAIAEITGAIWGTDADGNPFFRYPTQKHSGILVKDAPVNTDLAANTSVNLDAFDFDDSIDVSEGFANRLYILNAVDTKSTASSSGSQGSTTLTTRGVAQQWTATDNNVTSAAFILSRVGNPTTTSGSISGKLRADNNGYPNGATLATFEIPISSIDTSKSTIFVNDIKTKDGVINPGSKYWWYLLGTGLVDDSNTVRWHHDNDLSTADRLSAILPLVDVDPSKPGDQLFWIRSVFGPVYAFSTFSSVRHILTQSDSESIKQYGLIEGIVDLPAFEDDATFQKALAKIIYTSAKPKRTYEYARLTIPTQRIFLPGEMITIIDSKASLTSEKSVMAEIAEVSYNFDTGGNAMGCKYVDCRLIAFLDKTLDDYMSTREC